MTTKAELLRFFKELASDIVNHAFAVPVGDYKAAKQEVERLLLLNERALKALLTTPPESQLREALQEAREVLTEMGWHTDRGLLLRIIEALSTQPQDRKGWQWVPKEPTDEMVGYGHDAGLEYFLAENDTATVLAIWRAMIKAAPQPPEQSAQQVDDLDDLMNDALRLTEASVEAQIAEHEASAQQVSGEPSVEGTPLCDAIAAIPSIEDRYVPLMKLAKQLERSLSAKERELADQAKMVHDFPRLMEFYSKHALGSLLPPSCLTCGKTVTGAKGADDGPGIYHLELPNVVVCKPCTATLQSASAAPQEGKADYVDIVFDGPPSHESGRFVEVEDSTGKSIRFGEWVKRPDGYWVLRIPQ